MTQAPSETHSESPPSSQKKIAPRSALREYVEVAMWGIPIFLFFITFIAQNFKIPTQSMENTLLIGDHLTVNKFLYGPQNTLDKYIAPSRPPKRGDVVVFKYPGDTDQYWVKRLIGLPGDRLRILNDHLIINGQEVQESYAFYKILYTMFSERDPALDYRPRDYYTLKPGLEHVGEDSRKKEYHEMVDIRRATKRTLKKAFAGTDPKAYRRMIDRMETSSDDVIPPGFYFMMGDNRNRSMDSRMWGLVPEELLEGRAYWVWWSYGEDEGTHELEGFDFAKVYLRYPITFWQRTHWDQSFKRIR